MDYAHYQAQLAHAAGLNSPTAQTLAAVAGHNLSGANQGTHPSISQAVVSAAQLATVSYESMLAGSTSPALYTAGMHMTAPSAQHHMGLNTPVHHHHSNRQKKKPKINKDGIPAPKRATTAYINFTQWYREEIKKQGRTVPRIGDFGKECAAKWNNMPDDEKAPFVVSANKDRERYKKEMAIYKPVRDANKPKRPGTAFMLFMGDFRKEMAGREPEGGVAALAKLGGERWRGMTDEDKRPYIEKQSAEKVKYESSMEEYRRNQSAESSLAKQPRMSNPGEDSDSLSREGITVNMAQTASTESNSPHAPATPSSNNDSSVISQNQLQQQIQQMVAATQSQQLQNVAPPPAHSSSAALDFSTQHAANLQNFQTNAGSASVAINYSQALTQPSQETTTSAGAASQQQQQIPQDQQQSDSSNESSPNYGNSQTTAAAPNYNQAHLAGHYGWV